MTVLVLGEVLVDLVAFACEQAGAQPPTRTRLETALNA